MAEKQSVIQEYKIPIIVTLVIIIAIAALFSLRFILPEKQEMTISEVKERTIAGEETEINYLYNGYTFIKVGPLWYTSFSKDDQPYDIPFRYDPKSVEDIPVVVDQDFAFNKVYLTFDPNLTSRTAIAAIELGRITGDKYNIFNVPTKAALTRIPDTGYDGQTPIITCEDAVNDTGVFLLKLGNVTAIYAEEDCIIIQGKTEEDIIRGADRIAFKLIGIM